MQLSCNGIALEVEDHGPPSGEPLVLVMGLGMQLVAWPLPFVEGLVARGFRVIRFDNRDIGLSQSFDQYGMPNLVLAAMKATLGLKVTSPYTLADMAADTVGVLDALGIAGAHICGASMGGMIAQHLAVRAPERVRSLTLMMTTSGSRRLPGPSFALQRAMLARPDAAGGVPGIVAHYVALFGMIGSPGYPPPAAELRERLEGSIRRSFRPQGSARQLLAIAADGSRSRMLGEIRQPTCVIHGRADPLVPVAAGEDLAARIAGADIDLIDGMGHDLPRELWPRFVSDIAAVAARA
ncbi:MAG: alpha/beta fold hydrolase [Proteobacteria bacterium]|nr:alpha/beta fold hydrolase [Pseudomonadota bacterium]